MALSPVYADLVEHSGSRACYELSRWDDERIVVGRVWVDERPEVSALIDGGTAAERAAERLLGKILRARRDNGGWPTRVDHVS